MVRCNYPKRDLKKALGKMSPSAWRFSSKRLAYLFHALGCDEDLW
jgi:hypothetical protein